MSWEIGAYHGADDETLIVPLQVRLDIPRVQGKHNDSILVAQFPLQSIYKLDGGEFALHVQVPRVLFLSIFGIGDPIVFDGRVEVVLHGGRDPDDSAGIGGGGCRDEERVEKLDKEEVAEDVCAELEVEFLSRELVDWRDHYPSVCNQHVQLSFLPGMRKLVRQPRNSWGWGDILEKLLSGFPGSVQIAQVELEKDGFLASLLLEFVDGGLRLRL